MADAWRHHSAHGWREVSAGKLQSSGVSSTTVDGPFLHVADPGDDKENLHEENQRHEVAAQVNLCGQSALGASKHLC